MKQDKKLIIGVTGPIASGKNEVCDVFRDLGAGVIDADSIGHYVIKPKKKAYRLLAAHFGKKILSKNGAINRKALGDIVFAEPSALKFLDRTVHPEILKETRSRIIGSEKKIVVVNAALIYEMKMTKMMDVVICVLAPRKTRVDRLIKKGLSKKDALLRISTQRSDAFYRRISDKVIINTAGLKELRRKAAQIFSALNT